MADERDAETIAAFECIQAAILAILEATDARPSWFLTAARYEAYRRPSTPQVIPTVIHFWTNPQRCRTALKALVTPLRLEVNLGEATFHISARERRENPDYVATVPMGVSTGVEEVNSSGPFRSYIFEKSSKKRFRVMNGHVAAMHLKEQASSLPVTVRADDGVTMVQNSDQDHYKRLEQAEWNWEVAIEDDKRHGGQHESSRKARAVASAKVEWLH